MWTEWCGDGGIGVAVGCIRYTGLVLIIRTGSLSFKRWVVPPLRDRYMSEVVGSNLEARMEL